MINLQTKCNIVILMQQRMYASIRKTLRIFNLEFLFSNFSCTDNTKTHIVIHIIICIFNGNPMIPQYLKLVKYSHVISIQVSICLGHLQSEESLGHNANRLTISDSGLRCVTWCSKAVEHRIHYWGLEFSGIQKLGTFTPEEPVLILYTTNSLYNNSVIQVQNIKII